MKPFDIGVLGRDAEDRWEEELKKDGKVFVPTTLLAGNTDVRGAPSIVDASGKAIAIPDFNVYVPEAHWEEVKGKTRASYRRDMGRWEHGVDFAILEEYRQVAEKTKQPVMIALLEKNSPDCPQCGSELHPIKPATEQPDGIRARCKNRGCGALFDQPAMFAMNRWLTISLDDLNKYGQKRDDWPGGANDTRNRGKDGKGGWLWPRSKMTKRDMPVNDLRQAMPKGKQLKLI